MSTAPSYPPVDSEPRVDADPTGRCEITPAMIEAGVVAVLEHVGGADLGGWFSPEELAVRVFLAMRAADCSTQRP